QRQAARRGYPAAHAGEGAGANRHSDALEVGESEPRLLHDLGDHRHESLGMTALAQLEAVARQPLAACALPAHGYGDPAEAGIERQYIHAFAPHQGVSLDYVRNLVESKA